MLTDMGCPFCGSEMTEGRMAVISLTISAPIRVVWKASAEEHEGSQQLLSPGFLNRRTRPAQYCSGCDASVLEPLA
ncbi:MAG TPA: PF20097 family protein [Acidimicrobiales bacterium]|nr:PF20097 family protein [Acidimicrobiales bacterium]